jgi:eukaryotic-like serine/threonine-protein kinase
MSAGAKPPTEGTDRAESPQEAPRTEVALHSSSDSDTRATASLGTDGGAQPTVLERDEPGEDGRIGPYRLLRVLGQGGMGIVYEAEQEGPLRRRVALKLTQWGMKSQEVLARFESERQALALMNHANIAAVYEAGVTPEGRPYFVMEFVPGPPITTFCDEHLLTVSERLRLFQQVCEGVQHAHHRGIIHRDIKASNVLVALQDDKPVPKLIDFGIAKATGLSLTEKNMVTAYGQLVGTPAYMSPEQAALGSVDIDSRTDVYSLGVVLYELLVGARPFESREEDVVSLEETRRRIREEEPRRPSSRLAGPAAVEVARRRKTEPAALRRELQGELDWIVLKALEKDRTRRYGSPAELAADLSRHLSLEPVVAGPPGTAYRARKFVRRHRVAVAAAALTGTGLLLGTVFATYGLIRARRAEQAALRESAKATAINEFLQKTLGSARPSQGGGRELTVVEALDAAAGRIDSSFGDQPEIRAALEQTIGTTYADLGRYPEGKALLERSLDTRRRLLGSEHAEVAETLNSLGELYFDLGDYGAAEGRLREALDIRRRLGPKSLPVAETLNSLASTMQEGKGDYQGALPLAQEALDIRRSVLGNRHRDVAQGLNDLGMVYYRLQQYDRAEPLLRQALQLNRELLGSDHLEVSAVLNNLALLLRQKGEDAQAADLFRQALTISRKRLGSRHREVSFKLDSLGAVLCKIGQYDEGEKSLRESADIQREIFGEGYVPLATTRSLLGGCLTREGRYTEAELLLTASYATLRGSFGQDHPRARAARGRLVELYKAWGKPDQAARLESQASR